MDRMKRARIIHNPNAGDGELSKEAIIQLVSSKGYECLYTLTGSDDWKQVSAEDQDIIVLAGGDGTVRKMAGTLIDSRVPIALLPMGTANNIAKTLELPESRSEITERWSLDKLRPYDVGRIYGLEKGALFLEGFGYGVFPRLMKQMKKLSNKLTHNTREENLKAALETLHDIVINSKARFCKISIDGADHSGKFLVAEVMNARSIGPNLNLAPFGDPGDGVLEVILISERQRDEFASYVHNKIHGVDTPPIFNVLKAKNLDIYWEGKLLHIDDQIVQLDKPQEIKIKIQEGVLKFLDAR